MADTGGNYLQEGFAISIQLGPVREGWWYGLDARQLHLRRATGVGFFSDTYHIDLTDLAYFRREEKGEKQQVVLALNKPLPAINAATESVVHNQEGYVIKLPVKPGEAESLARLLDELGVPRQQPGQLSSIAQQEQRILDTANRQIKATTGLSRATWDRISLVSTIACAAYFIFILVYGVVRYGWSVDYTSIPEGLLLFGGLAVLVVPVIVSYYYTSWQDLTGGRLGGPGKVVLLVLALLAMLLVAQGIMRLLVP